MRIHYILMLYPVLTLIFGSGVSAQYCEPVNKLDIFYPSSFFPPLIDGSGDEQGYCSFQELKIVKRAGVAVLSGPEDGDSVDFNAKFKAFYYDDYLYLYIEVTDDIEESMPVGGQNPSTWDNIEIFIDLDTNSTTPVYDTIWTVCLRFNRGDAELTATGNATASDFLYEQINDYNKWIVEMAVPWSAASGVDGFPGFLRTYACVIGFDLAVTDADGPGSGTSGGRDEEGGAVMYWDLDTPTEITDNIYQDRRLFGFLHPDFLLCHNDIYDSYADTCCFVIYPNPAKDYLIIQTDSYSGIQDYSVKIINMLGETILETEIKQPEHTIDLSNLTGKGIHLIRLIDSAHNVLKVRKLIIQ